MREHVRNLDLDLHTRPFPVTLEEDFRIKQKSVLIECAYYAKQGTIIRVQGCTLPVLICNRTFSNTALFGTLCKFGISMSRFFDSQMATYPLASPSPSSRWT